ncbi:5-methyltetrahydropteroyltriglutamate--homocysteine S-methyltransferase [Neobacillus mesonae]|nr:5-methyltetrahydropteroyltriglutamate--homocysteine S-methyltransferase [Neobacillus mesonae]
MSQIAQDAKVRTVTPFRYDIVGSFLRPEALRKARAQFLSGEISQQELTKIEDAEIIRLVDKQKEVGLKAVTDGEFRRSWWHLDFMWGLAGVEHVIMSEGYPFVGAETRKDSAQLAGKVGFNPEHPFLAHYKFLKEAAGNDVVARQAIPAPAQFLFELQRGEYREVTARIYPNNDELVRDTADAYRKTILAFYELGCRSIQLDDCTWGALCDQGFIAAFTKNGGDVKALAETLARVNSEAIVDLPQDLVVTTHVCRGNYNSTWASSGGYEPIAETLLGIDNYDAFYLEFDTDRAGDFKPLRFLRSHQQVVIGLFSSKIGELENKQEILNRIEEATQYVDINRICLSPQCGFASTEEGNLLTEEQQWNKLAFIKEVADEIWN